MVRLYLSACGLFKYLGVKLFRVSGFLFGSAPLAYDFIANAFTFSLRAQHC